jgi:hypothetical protein
MAWHLTLRDNIIFSPKPIFWQYVQEVAARNVNYMYTLTFYVLKSKRIRTFYSVPTARGFFLVIKENGADCQ